LLIIGLVVMVSGSLFAFEFKKDDELSCQITRNEIVGTMPLYQLNQP